MLAEIAVWVGTGKTGWAEVRIEVGDWFLKHTCHYFNFELEAKGECAPLLISYFTKIMFLVRTTFKEEWVCFWHETSQSAI